MVRWNSDKHYLRTLARQGLPVVASAFVEPDEDAAAALEQFLAQHASAEVVVKPAVGAGSRDTRRHARAAVPAMLAHMRDLLAARRSVLLQPYLPSVDRDGETALIYIDGCLQPRHPQGRAAARRWPPRPQALFAAEDITRAGAGSR